jgi:hypothetical protein
MWASALCVELKSQDLHDASSKVYIIADYLNAILIWYSLYYQNEVIGKYKATISLPLLTLIPQMAHDSKFREQLQLVLIKYSIGIYERHNATVRTFFDLRPAFHAW